MSRAATIHPPRKASPDDMRAIAADLLSRADGLEASAAKALRDVDAMRYEAKRWLDQADIVEAKACPGCGKVRPLLPARYGIPLCGVCHREAAGLPDPVPYRVTVDGPDGHPVEVRP